MPLSSRMPDLPARELLLAVGRLGSLGRAAKEAGISQPAASARTRTLERPAGVPLPEREPGSGTREDLAYVLARHPGTPAPPLLAFASTTALEAAAVSGAGPAVLSPLAVADDVAAERLIAVHVAGLRLDRVPRVTPPRGPRPTAPARELPGPTLRKDPD